MSDVANTSGTDLDAASRRLAERVAAGPHETARADELAWAALGLVRREGGRDQAMRAGQQLVERQAKDGRVCVYPETTEAFWPTAAAILAWKALGSFAAPRDRAADFLVATYAAVPTVDPAVKQGHDITIPGWPWIEGTSAWVEPTATAVLALRAAGRTSHERTGEGVRLLVNRQIPSGGWNPGNVAVYGHQLLPTPECTGIALCALAGLVDEATVAPSLALLRGDLPNLHTPLALGWALFAAKAWDIDPGNVRARAEACAAEQTRVGAYDPALLGLLLAAVASDANLFDLLAIRRETEKDRG